MGRMIVEPINRLVASKISSWKYSEPYDFYNMNDDAGMDELLNGTYFKVHEDEMLVGYCCFGKSAIVPIGLQFGAYPENGTVDVGLGMRPDLTGQGRGYVFVSSILEFAMAEYNSNHFRLTVAQFNKRAIALYEKLGFKPIMVFPMGDVEFLTMERRIC
ncbi:GNAT family N-acetyltransferase [Sulfobacillus thermosulfidooxidans]|uniref:GNAT family N-acetyltransferase n=1 Tax=Sulfobacillus thermosulfidooxidans TaxID=28034 RepID=UPI000371BDFA|nr:GNAT family protein [Sulfobacillus thermosulfidooxidans]